MPPSGLDRGPRADVVVLTHLTSPYQVELFDAVATDGRCALEVFYLHSTSNHRSWRERPIHHRHAVVGRNIQQMVHERVAAADLVVFNYYDDSRAAILMKERARSGKSWCFWGERPGVRVSGWLGRLYRRRKLAPLSKSRAAIWGIGCFALEQYRREFGTDRMFRDLPYYSDLSRFDAGLRSGRCSPGETTFLYSGALITRKGVGLLARAFLRLAAQGTDVRLRLLGDGPLRAQLERALQPVAGRVTFVGFRDWEHLPSEYRKADVLCVPSLHDGWGLVVPEALASGMPVIASDRTGAALGLLRPKVNGWLIPAGDESALLSAMADAASLSEQQLTSCSTAAVASVAGHSLENGAIRFVDASVETLRGWHGGVP